tara:strand:- start:448 stop:1284 length:837 start_codon:yes stop_codon:yes gene_type:complete
MKAVSNSELLELTHDFITEWHGNFIHQNIIFRGRINPPRDDVYWQKKTGNIYVNERGQILGCDTFRDAQEETHDHSVYEPLAVETLVYCGDWTRFAPEPLRIKARGLLAASTKKLLDHRFRHLVLTEPKGHLGRVLKLVNIKAGTSTKFMHYLSQVGSQENIESVIQRFELVIVMIFAAAIHVIGDPENYSNDAVEANVMREMLPSKDVIKHAKKLSDALIADGYPAGSNDVIHQEDIEKARFMREIKTLADGKPLASELEPTGKHNKWVIREITLFI